MGFFIPDEVAGMARGPKAWGWGCCCPRQQVTVQGAGSAVPVLRLLSRGMCQAVKLLSGSKCALEMGQEAVFCRLLP